MASRLLAAFALLVLPALAGCVSTPGAGDGGDPRLEAPRAPYVLPDVVTKLDPVRRVDFGGGNDIAFKGGYAYVSSRSGLHVVDIRDPENATEVGSVPCRGIDVGVVETTKGRIATISYQGDDGCPGAAPSGGIRLVDVTDPANPVALSQVPLKYGSHTHTPWGDTGLVYNSAYDLVNVMAHHKSEIVDVSDPTAPKVVGAFEFPATSKAPGCHDILAEPERSRAICGGIHETMIWDMKDPMKPRVIATLTNPAINIHHSAATALNGTLLIIGDESGGALAPACPAHGRTPTGALWFYTLAPNGDVQLKGYFSPPRGNGNVCTAHNFNVVADRPLVVAGFYSGGTMLVDFKDPANPKLVSQVAPPDGSAWAAYWHEGAVYTGDGGRGLDVYRLR
ncbi:MAG TPA: hypothetical protein VM889_11695 [Candidatus Thermoplasmatota archaeon]|nr:hypothetical protein [Candidatus Thermoplasmatota archaeon]